MGKFEPIYQMEERLDAYATDRLQRLARNQQNDFIREEKLPQPFDVIVKVTRFGIVPWVYQVKIREKATPVAWERRTFGRGKDNILVIGMKLRFECEQSTFWGWRKRTYTQTTLNLSRLDDKSSLGPDFVALAPGVKIPAIFKTDVKIYPLTIQQAAFVGYDAKQADWRHGHPQIVWGTTADVDQIKKGFPLALTPVQ